MAGERIYGPGTDRAMVFQEFGLLPVAHGAGNRELGLELKDHEAGARRQIFQRLIVMVGLSGSKVRLLSADCPAA